MENFVICYFFKCHFYCLLWIETFLMVKFFDNCLCCLWQENGFVDSGDTQHEEITLERVSIKNLTSFRILSWVVCITNCHTVTGFRQGVVWKQNMQWSDSITVYMHHVFWFLCWVNVLVYSARAQQVLVLVLVAEKITLTLIMTLEFTSQELSKEVQLQKTAGWCK